MYQRNNFFYFKSKKSGDQSLRKQKAKLRSFLVFHYKNRRKRIRLRKLFPKHIGRKIKQKVIGQKAAKGKKNIEKEKMSTLPAEKKQKSLFQSITEKFKKKILGGGPGADRSKFLAQLKANAKEKELIRQTKEKAESSSQIKKQKVQILTKKILQ